ncbi:hypothetical protein ACN38_g9602 [Penicillium nordicum]|uniref:Uncharacterized protein n=1 Tax=Penicillium nordicum TaxID=229535 RepID=A0A0M8P1T0_9EURO|nr:hypothetical protein ACN38_g9602 [Penicillium nordicum]
MILFGLGNTGKPIFNEPAKFSASSDYTGEQMSSLQLKLANQSRAISCNSWYSWSHVLSCILPPLTPLGLRTVKNTENTALIHLPSSENNGVLRHTHNCITPILRD